MTNFEVNVGGPFCPLHVRGKGEGKMQWKNQKWIPAPSTPLRTSFAGMTDVDLIRWQDERNKVAFERIL